jgi:hypothetical protein
MTPGNPLRNYHTDHVRFIANGDPYPSEVLMHVAGTEARFRTTTEDVLAFLAALTLDALPHSKSGTAIVDLRSTSFEMNFQTQTVLLRRVGIVELDEVDFITVPLQDLKDFARQAISRHLTYRLDDETLMQDSLLFGMVIGAQHHRAA